LLHPEFLAQLLASPPIIFLLRRGCSLVLRACRRRSLRAGNELGSEVDAVAAVRAVVSVPRSMRSTTSSFATILYSSACLLRIAGVTDSLVRPTTAKAKTRKRRKRNVAGLPRPTLLEAASAADRRAEAQRPSEGVATTPLLRTG